MCIRKKNKRTIILFGSTLFIFITLYLPQPLQPEFAALYQRSSPETALLITVTLIPLAVLPLLYGYLPGNIRPAKLLKPALAGLGLCNIAFASIHHFSLLLTIRFLIGCLIPIIIPALIALLLQHTTRAQKTLSLYVTFTIIGGFSGRFLSSLFDTYLNWETFSWICGGVLLLFSGLLTDTPTQDNNFYRRTHLKDFLALLTTPVAGTMLLIIYASFGSFVAVLNYLPFILRKTFPDASSLVTGIMYSGYIFSAVISLLSTRIITGLGVRRSLMVANLVFLAALGLLFPNNLILMFFVLFAFCAAFFLTHAVALAEVNRNSPYPKMLTNACYTAFYYCGGAVGSWLPGLIFERYGKNAFLVTLIVVSLSTTLSILYLPRNDDEAIRFFR